MNEYYKIEDVCKVKGGKRIPQGCTLQKTPNKHPYIRILDMYQGRIINISEEMQYAKDEYWNAIKSYIVKKGDVILAIVGNTLGMVSIIGDTLDNANLTENCCKFDDLDTNKVRKLFLYYSLIAPLNQKNIEKFKVGSSQPKLPIYNINRLLLPRWSVKVQDKIAGILSALDSKIEINIQMMVELESMAKTIYDYWFLQFEFPNEEGKPYKSSGGKMVWNDELKREIPEGWEVKEIGTILGAIPKTKKYSVSEYKQEGKYPIIDQSKKYICGYTDNQDDLIKFESAIIFGDHTKEIKYANFPFARGADGTQILVSKNDRLSNYLLYLQICQMDLVNQGYSRYFKFLKDRMIIIPSETINKKFEKITCDFNIKVRNNIFENQSLMSLRDFLLPLLMNGQVGFKS